MKSRIAFAQERLEFVFEGEDEERRCEIPAIDLFQAFSALNEYLRDIQDPGTNTGCMRRH